MRSNLKAAVVLSTAILALTAVSCAKKAPAPPPAPPAQQTPTPTPVPTPTPAPTTPTPAPTPAVTVSDLKTVFFPLDSYALDDASRAVLDANARLLRDRPDLTVRIEGHCDERGTVEYNMSLGEKRAESVRDYLVAAGVGQSRLSTISYGKERPMVDGHDEATWSKNRRAEFSKP